MEEIPKNHESWRLQLCSYFADGCYEKIWLEGKAES